MTIAELLREDGAALVCADHDGRITEVNAAFTALFGWSREEAVGRPLTLIIPKNLHDAHQLGFSRFLTTSQPTLLEQALTLRAVAKDGREFDAEHFIVAERRGQRWAFAGRIRPLP